VQRAVLEGIPGNQKRRETNFSDSKPQKNQIMKATQITLTPALAQMLLEKNPNNRRLSEQRAIHLANAIRRGEWQLNGESVIVSEDGSLLDGQHRCRAVVIAEMAIPVILVEGVPSKAFTTIDIGEKRSIGQIFQIHY
jgi:hypothetical protein